MGCISYFSHLGHGPAYELNSKVNLDNLELFTGWESMDGRTRAVCKVPLDMGMVHMLQ